MRVTSMRLALLLVVVPLVADAAPSAVNIDATLAHDRELLASHATAVCACKDQRCARPHVDAVLRWDLEQTLMATRKPFEAYLEAVANDLAIGEARRQFSDCNAALFLKASCKQRIASAAASFARAAPKAYAPYKTLKFDVDHKTEPLAFTTVTIRPGRSWHFRATIGPHSMLDSGTFGQLGTEWGRVDNELGVTLGKKLGPIAVILDVNSERWGEFEPEQHPLTKLFLAKFRAAAEACVK